MNEALTPEQIADLEGKVKQLPIFKKHEDDITSLKKNDEEIIGDLEGLKEGQKQLEEKVDLGFEKGRVRMDGIEKMIKDSDKKRDEQHTEVLNKITDNEITRLTKKLEDKDTKIASQEAKKWDLTRGAAIVFFGLIGAVFLYLIGVK